MAESNLHSLVLIFAVSALTPLLADASKRVRVPAVVLEIVKSQPFQMKLSAVKGEQPAPTQAALKAIE